MPYTPGDYWPELHRRERKRLSAVGYAELGEGFNRVTYWQRLRAVRCILHRYGATPASVLEGAVGVGAYASLWRSLQVFRWVGIDISHAAVEDLAHRFPDQRFRAADLTDSGALADEVGEETFDLVTAIDVLYHIVDDDAFAAALENLARFVRPGCLLLVSDVFVEQATQVAPHVRRRPLHEYARILEALGLKLVAREAVFSVLGDPVPRRGRILDHALNTMWRVTQKTIRCVPIGPRDTVGAVVAALLLPIDAMVRSLGLSEGVNLELALFTRGGTERPDDR